MLPMNDILEGVCLYWSETGRCGRSDDRAAVYSDG
jgi:hypothetical protein